MATRSRCADVDVVIVGGGPAGANAAALLSAWGRSVVVVHGDSATPSLAESLPLGTRKLFQFLGLAEIVDAAGFYPNHGNISRWADQEALARTDGDGYHVPRARFDRLLLDHALARGAVMVEGHARNIEVNGTVTIARRGSSECQSYRGRYVLDRSGRRGCHRQSWTAPAGHRLPDAGRRRRMGLRAMAGGRTHVCVRRQLLRRLGLVGSFVADATAVHGDDRRRSHHRAKSRAVEPLRPRVAEGCRDRQTSCECAADRPTVGLRRLGLRLCESFRRVCSSCR